MTNIWGVNFTKNKTKNSNIFLNKFDFSTFIFVRTLEVLSRTVNRTSITFKNY